MGFPKLNFFRNLGRKDICPRYLTQTQMRPEFPPMPLLVKTLTLMHWNNTADEMFSSDRDEVVACVDGLWEFKVKRRHGDLSMFDAVTYYQGREVARTTYDFWKYVAHNSL
jgi:hypothetical protein